MRKFLLYLVVALLSLSGTGSALDLSQFVAGGALTGTNFVTTITAPTSATTYSAGTTDTLATFSGTGIGDRRIRNCTWTNSLGGSGSATINQAQTTWTVSNVALTIGDNVLTVTCTDNSGTQSQDVLTVTRDSASELIDPSRTIDWNPGVTGTIPTLTTPCATLSSGATGAQIQTALSTCLTGDKFVQLGAGTYTITSSSGIQFPTGVRLKGAGIDSTTLNCSGNWHCLMFGAFPSAPSSIKDVSGSPAKDATSFVISNTTGLVVGDYLIIDQTNDGVEVVNDTSATPVLTAFGASECRGSTTIPVGGQRCLGQMVQITACGTSTPGASCSSTTITFTPSLHHAYTAARSPQVWEVTGVTSGMGIEDLTITRTNHPDAGYHNIYMVATADSWIKNVKSNSPDEWHVVVDRSIHNEIRDSYFKDGQDYDGGDAYGAVMNLYATDNLVENNIFEHTRHAMLVQSGAAGNVFGYNYSFDCFQGLDNWLPTDMNSHGSHTHMNLWEGNIGCKIYADNAHGSASYNTYYRNHVARESFPPEYPSGQTSGRRAVDIEVLNRYINIVGNVLGQPTQSWTSYDPGATRTASSGQYVYTFGYFSDGDGTRDDATIVTDTYRHGNWDYLTDAVAWDSGNTNHTLLDSLYLDAEPSFFGSCVWPPIDPEGSTKVNTLPAEDRYNGGDGACTPPSLTITTTSLPNATEDSAYSQTVSATGGTAPYVFTNNGAGTTLNDADAECAGLSIATSGSITGTPTVTGTCSFTALVTDAVLATDTQALSIVVDAAGSSFYFTGNLRNPTANTTTAINTRISESVDRDIVRMSTNGCSITGTTITISGKGILLDLNGCTFASGVTLNISADTNTNVRVTNFTLPCHDNALNISGTLLGSGMIPRVDHFTLTGSDLNGCLEIEGGGVLIDHMTIAQSDQVDEFIHIGSLNNMYTPCIDESQTTYAACGWDTAAPPGSVLQVYIEDSTLSRDESGGNPTWSQAYYGIRFVYRFNTFTGWAIDNHGTGGNVGGRWWEVYHNTFNQGSGGWNRRITNMRAGSGLVFGNTKAAALNGYGVCEEDTGYPASYQVGRGQNGALTPAYFFDDTISVGLCSDAGDTGIVQANRDYFSSVSASCPAGGACTSGVGSGTTLPTSCTLNTAFWKTDEGGDWWTTGGDSQDGLLYKCVATNDFDPYYTPYTYPHPLQTGLEPDK